MAACLLLGPAAANNILARGIPKPFSDEVKLLVIVC